MSATRPAVPARASRPATSHCVAGKRSHEGSSAFTVHTGLFGHVSPDGWIQYLGDGTERRGRVRRGEEGEEG
eukprot:7085871-Prymnesium_polylepis.1